MSSDALLEDEAIAKASDTRQLHLADEDVDLADFSPPDSLVISFGVDF